VSYRLGFIFSGNANCATGLQYTMRDDFAMDSSHSIVVKNIKINSTLRKNTVRSCQNIFDANYDTLKNVLYFWADRQRSLWNVLHFFQAQRCHAKFSALAHCTYVLQRSHPCYCCV